jgi:exodeoxyribonuclease VII small subunit
VSEVGTSSDNVTFEQAMTRLEEIVQQLEKGSLGLAESLDVFREGMQLVGRLTRDLDQAEATVNELVEAADGSLTTRPFAPEDGTSADGSATGG